MKWRVTIELSDVDGTKQTHEVARGGGSDPYSTFDPLGLTLDDSKALLAGVQRHLVQARVAEYCALRRRCSHCGRLRPLKDTRRSVLIRSPGLRGINDGATTAHSWPIALSCR